MMDCFKKEIEFTEKTLTPFETEIECIYDGKEDNYYAFTWSLIKEYLILVNQHHPIWKGNKPVIGQKYNFRSLLTGKLFYAEKENHPSKIDWKGEYKFLDFYETEDTIFKLKGIISEKLCPVCEKLVGVNHPNNCQCEKEGGRCDYCQAGYPERKGCRCRPKEVEVDYHYLNTNLYNPSVWYQNYNYSDFYYPDQANYWVASSNYFSNNWQESYGDYNELQFVETEDDPQYGLGVDDDTYFDYD